MKLAPYLLRSLESIARNQGEDVDYVFGGINRKTALSYVSRLRSEGLAYTCRWNGNLEVWLTKKGQENLDVLIGEKP